jgi:hypothetical protein
MYQLLESGLAAALRLANQGTILDTIYALHHHSPRLVSSPRAHYEFRSFCGKSVHINLPLHHDYLYSRKLALPAFIPGARK